MVATVEDILDIIRSNPFIDGVGYFVEITTSEPVPQGAHAIMAYGETDGRSEAGAARYGFSSSSISFLAARARLKSNCSSMQRWSMP